MPEKQGPEQSSPKPVDLRDALAVYVVKGGPEWTLHAGPSPQSEKQLRVYFDAFQKAHPGNHDVVYISPHDVQYRHFVITHPDSDHANLKEMFSTLPTPQEPAFGRWQILVYLLSAKARKEVLEPMWAEIQNDYETACRECSGGWQRQVIPLVFAFRTVRMLCQCIRAVVGDRFLEWLARLAPQLVKWFWPS
jgi:hypothetical protein